MLIDKTTGVLRQLNPHQMPNTPVVTAIVAVHQLGTRPAAAAPITNTTTTAARGEAPGYQRIEDLARCRFAHSSPALFATRRNHSARSSAVTWAFSPLGLGSTQVSGEAVDP